MIWLQRQDDPNTETAGLSQNSMKAMISADNSVKQSDAQKVLQRH